MEYLTYNNFLIALFSMLIIVIFVMEVVPKITKKGLTEEQFKCLIEAQKYARELIVEIQKNYGENPKEQKEKIVNILVKKFPKLNRKILELAYDIALKAVNEALQQY